MSMPRPGRRTRLAAGVVAATALLAGCGDANPGVAVRAGEETISVREVDRVAEDFCTALTPQLEAQDPLPLRFIRSGVAGIMAQRSVATQLAEEYDVEPGSQYEDRVAATQKGLGELDDDVQAAVITIDTAGAYIEGVQAAVGDLLLSEEGAPGSPYSERVARGQQAYDEWIAENGVEFDPQFGVDLVKGQIQPVDTSVSFAVGEVAKAGQAEQPDPAYAGSLPSAHTCGA